MSLPVLVWVLDHSTATLGARLVLLVLAEHAHDDGRESYPALDTIAQRARLSRKGARDALARLERDGHIERDGFGPRGQTRWRLLFLGEKELHPPNREGGVAAVQKREAATPEPTTEPSNEKEDPRAKPPPGFPDELRPHAREVLRVLTAVAEQHGCKRVWPLEVGRAVMARPRHPLVAVAHELAGWAADPPRPITDIVATYRTFLKNAKELASVERLAADGTPTASIPPHPPGVTSLRGYDRNAAKAAREAEREQAAMRVIEQRRQESRV